MATRRRPGSAPARPSRSSQALACRPRRRQPASPWGCPQVIPCGAAPSLCTDPGDCLAPPPPSLCLHRPPPQPLGRRGATLTPFSRLQLQARPGGAPPSQNPGPGARAATPLLPSRGGRAHLRVLPTPYLHPAGEPPTGPGPPALPDRPPSSCSERGEPCRPLPLGGPSPRTPYAPSTLLGRHSGPGGPLSLSRIRDGHSKVLGGPEPHLVVPWGQKPDPVLPPPRSGVADPTGEKTRTTAREQLS